MSLRLKQVLGMLACGWALSLAQSGMVSAQVPTGPVVTPRSDYSGRTVANTRPWYQGAPRSYLTDPGSPAVRAGRPSNVWVPARGVSTRLAQNQAVVAPNTTAPATVNAPPTAVAPSVTTVPQGTVPVAGSAPGALVPVPQTNPATGDMVIGNPPVEGDPMAYGAPMGGEYVEYGGLMQGGETFGGCHQDWHIFGDGVLFRYFSADAGVVGFQGPIDQGRNGNFGVQVGCDVAGPIGGLFSHNANTEIAYQLGVGGVFTDFYGNPEVPIWGTPNSHRQLFFTAGFFRRPQCMGLEWSVLFDYLGDSMYSDYDMKQIRGEIAMANAGCVDYGFWGAFRLNTYSLTIQDQRRLLQPLNMYNGFVRGRLECGGEWRVWAGASGEGDGLVGGDLRIPIAQHWAIENNVLCLIPNSSGTAADRQARETWAVSFNLVWYPGQSAHCMDANPYKPVLPRASNVNMITDFRTQ